jgi:4-hydroxy-tetrahydrodipicolinate synthase
MKLTRRECLAAFGASVVAGATGAERLRAAAAPPVPGSRAALTAVDGAAAKPLRGPFMILHTPFTEDGAVDWEDLTREAQFVDRCGGAGVVWPQGSSSVATLTRDERMHGMEVLAKAVAGRRLALVLGVQGKDIAEMLEYTRRAEELAPNGVIAMPPTTGTSMEDYRAYFRALGGATKRPVVLQTSGGARNLVPSTDLIIELAREFPHFGYVKEESEPLADRIRAEVAQKPSPMKAIFSANLGSNWLYAMRLGVDGVITGNSMYADLFARMWALHDARKEDELRDAFSRFLLMRNLNEQIPGTDLYVMKKRGIFKTVATRSGRPAAGEQPKVRVRSFSPVEVAEIEYRLGALRPYLSSEVLTSGG